MSECSLIKRLCASLINQMIIDWETHSLSSFQSTSSSTLQLSKSISWQVLLFCFMIIQILKHSWFVQFSTIIWFWIEIISLIKSLLAFDSCFKSESDLSQIWVRSWSAFCSSSWSTFIDCSSNLSSDNSIWCWYSFRSSFASTDLTSDILINASTFKFCFFDWCMILKLYSDNFSAHLACHLISSLMIMKYFKFRWSMKIVTSVLNLLLKRTFLKRA